MGKRNNKEQVKLNYRQAAAIYRRMLRSAASVAEENQFNAWARGLRSKSAISEMRRRTNVHELGEVVRCRGVEYFTVDLLQIMAIAYFGTELVSDGKENKYKELLGRFEAKRQRVKEAGHSLG